MVLVFWSVSVFFFVSFDSGGRRRRGRKQEEEERKKKRRRRGRRGVWKKKEEKEVMKKGKEKEEREKNFFSLSQLKKKTDNNSSPRVRLEQLQDRQHDVVDVAKARSLGLLGVVHPARPVEADVGPLVVEQRGAADRAARVELLLVLILLF